MIFQHIDMQLNMWRTFCSGYMWVGDPHLKHIRSVVNKLNAILKQQFKNKCI